MKKFFFVTTLLITYNLAFAGINEKQELHKVVRRGNMVLARYDRELTSKEIRYDLPPAMLAWQEWVGTDEEMTTSLDHVDPLLGTEWGQNNPFNLLCPVINDTTAPTGCIATAMAQVLFYWQQYVEGYDWSQMLTNYTNFWGTQANTAQKNAVAQLMVDCGKAVDMNYGTRSSGTNSVKVVSGMVKNFGFSNSAHFVYRKYMTYAEWAELLRNELRANRPVYYRGVSTSVNHAFVIDGFNEEGLFHVNWGWNGVGNGWFRFTALNPLNKGTGGGSSKDGYNYQQGMILNLAPAAVLHTEPTPTLYADSLSCAIGRNGQDSLALRGIKNLTSDTLRGKISLALCQNGQFIRRVKNSSFTYAPATSMVRYYSAFTLSDLTPGATYELVAQWQEDGTEEWQPIISTMGNPIKRTFTAINESQVSWNPSQTGMGHPVLTSQESTTFATGHFASFVTTWTTDYSEWNGWITLALENEDHFQEIYTGGVDLRQGQTDSLTIMTNPTTLPVGRYALRWGYYTDNLTGIVWLDGEDSVSIIKPLTANKLYYDSYVIADTSLTLINPDLDIILKLHLPDGGTENAIFSGSVGLGVYYDTYPEPSERILSLMTQPMVILYQDTFTYHFKSDLANNLPEGRYRIMVRSRASGKDAFSVNYSSAPIYVTIHHTQTSLETIKTDRQPNAKKIWKNGHFYIHRDGHRYSALGIPIGTTFSY